MPNAMPAAWRRTLAPYLAHDDPEKITTFLTQVYQDPSQVVYPARADVFRAFDLTAPEETRVVILGQDPYINPNQAQGLSFSVPMDQPLPPSLKNIYRELEDDLGELAPHHGDLTNWAQQGVLLLNAVLTVPAGKSNGHAGQVWEPLTDAVIEAVAALDQPVVFILWGAYAQKKARLIQGPQNQILAAPHPSPLSAYRGFFGSQPFSQANAYLLTQGSTPIDWTARF